MLKKKGHGVGERAVIGRFRRLGGTATFGEILLYDRGIDTSEIFSLSEDISAIVAVGKVTDAAAVAIKARGMSAVFISEEDADAICEGERAVIYPERDTIFIAPKIEIVDDFSTRMRSEIEQEPKGRERFCACRELFSGKIGMWAYGASRVLDYVLTHDDLDSVHTAVIGHSRLGKTALWAAAQDERFWCGISNNSGYGGAASSKHGTGERVTDFIRVGSWDWYCENFKEYTGEKEDCKPYDQAYLLAAIAPRLLCVGSAEEDRGADPKSEFLTSLHASCAWEMLGKKGLVSPDRLPTPGDHLTEGSVGYHLRSFGHCLSRNDWNAYIKFLSEKLK